MSRPTPTLGYPTRTAAIVALSAKGIRSEQIAERLGITLNLVHVLKSAAKRRGPSAGLKNKPRNEVAVQIDANDIKVLKPQADKRGIDVNELVRRLITAIADDGLVDGVLDDDCKKERV